MARDHDPIIAAGNGDEEPMRVTRTAPEPSCCPNPECGATGRKDHRITVAGRSPYRCPECGELWIDASEEPRSSGKDMLIGGTA